MPSGRDLGTYRALMAVTNISKEFDPWRFLQYGDAERGLALLREAHARQRSSSHIMELGVAYLWTKDYTSARAHFRKAIEDFPLHASSFYGMAGVSQWCLGEYTAAVTEWQAGLKAQYADTSGLGIRLPLLLFVASVLKPPVFQRKHAEELLREKVKDERANDWPGAAAKFVLGQLGELESLALTPVALDFDRKHREWVIRYYRNLLAFVRNELSPVEFAEALRILTDTSLPAMSDPNYFLALMWSEEFFIARRQAHSA